MRDERGGANWRTFHLTRIPARPSRSTRERRSPPRTARSMPTRAGQADAQAPGAARRAREHDQGLRRAWDRLFQRRGSHGKRDVRRSGRSRLSDNVNRQHGRLGQHGSDRPLKQIPLARNRVSQLKGTQQWQTCNPIKATTPCHSDFRLSACDGQVKGGRQPAALW
jgi:hypothetical protein